MVRVGIRNHRLPFSRMEVSAKRLRCILWTARCTAGGGTGASAERFYRHARGRTRTIQGTHVEERRVCGRRIRQKQSEKPSLVPGRTRRSNHATFSHRAVEHWRIVSSGTLTAGHLTDQGDHWTAEVEGISLPPLTLRLT